MHGAVSSQEAQGADATHAPGAVSRDDNNDVALALALAARAVEYVVDLGAGRYGASVTYGPGQRITGIVLRRSAQSEDSAESAAPAFVAEAHIVVAAAAVSSVVASDTDGSPVLLWIANEARRALAATLQRLRPNEKWDIDITIDDLRDGDAGALSGAQ